MIRFAALLIVPCAVAALCGGCERPGKPPASDCPPILRGSALQNLTLVSIDDRAGVKLITLTNFGWTLKIDLVDGIEQPDAEMMSRDGVMGVEALYAQALSPYPGDISKEVTSDKRFSPRLVKLQIAGKSCSGFLLFANDRLGYGAATADSVAFKSLVTWLYCAGRKELYKLRLFAPPAVADAELIARVGSISCPAAH